MLKIYAFLAKLPTLSDAAFFAHWHDPHGTLTKRIPQFRRYVQNEGVGSRPQVNGFAFTPYLGIATIWLDDLAALAAANAHPDYPALDADGDALYDRAQLLWLITRETVIRPAPAGIAAQPVKAMLFLRAGSRPLTEPILRSLLEEAERQLPHLAGASLSVPEASTDAPFDAVLELGFAHEDAFRADWSAADDMLTALEAAIDPQTSRGFLARENRVIWPESAETEYHG